MNNITLIQNEPFYDQESNAYNAYVGHYMHPFITKGSKESIANIVTKAAILKTGTISFPVTINYEEYENSYVCSPYTACVSYAQEEMDKLKNKPLETVLSAISNSLGLLLKKATINKVVCVNNWMLSTNLYAPWNGSNIFEIKDFLTCELPEHAIMFRSLNEHSNAQLINSFKDNGFMLIPSRQVYIFGQGLSVCMDRHNTKIDLKALEKTEHKVIAHDDIAATDYARIVELYNLLYIDKYSHHNPQFTAECIAHWHQKKLLTIMGLRNEQGVLDGVLGFFEQNGITTAPLVGYDTKLPRQFALYRILMALALKRAHDKNLTLNLSSGAADFKQLRGGQAFIEYSAVYINHLPRFNRFVWKLTNFLLTYIGIPIMKAFKL